MRRVLLVVALLVLVAVGAGVAYYLRIQQESRDVQGSSTIEFVTTGAAATPPAPKEPGVAWPTYGQNAERHTGPCGGDLQRHQPSGHHQPQRESGD